MPNHWLPPDSYLTEPDEIHGTARVEFTNDALTASVALKCLWDERNQVLDEILSNWAILSWPYIDSPQLFPVSGTIEPFLGEGQKSTAVPDAPGLLAYDLAMLTVNYSTLSGQLDDSGDDPVLYSVEFRPSTEFITLPVSRPKKDSSGDVLRDPNGNLIVETLFEWASGDNDPLTAEEAPGRLVIGGEYRVTYYNVLSVPAAFRNLAGHCNNTTVNSLLFSSAFPAESLLYAGCTINLQQRLAATERTVTASFLHREEGWNKLWRASIKAYDAIVFAGTDTPYESYQPADLSPVLPP